MLRTDNRRSAYVPYGPLAMRLLLGLIVALLLALGVASTVHGETAVSSAPSSMSTSLSSEHHEQGPLAESSVGSPDLTAAVCVVGALFGVMVFARLVRARLLVPARNLLRNSAQRASTPLIPQLRLLRPDRAQLQVSRT